MALNDSIATNTSRLFSFRETSSEEHPLRITTSPAYEALHAKCVGPALTSSNLMSFCVPSLNLLRVMLRGRSLHKDVGHSVTRLRPSFSLSSISFER